MPPSAPAACVVFALVATIAPARTSAAEDTDALPAVPLVRIADPVAGAPWNAEYRSSAGLLLVPRVAEPVRPVMRQVVPAAPAVTRRPAALLPLYVVFGGLQVADLVTTQRALNGGTAREANPVMGPFAGNLRASIALKAASTTATILLTEHLWKKDRAAAVALMAALGSAYAVIAVHNARVAQ